MQKIRQLIQAGELGKIFAVDLVFHNAWGPDKKWFYDRKQSGGGCVMDLGIHLVDAALWALDAEVTGVQATVFANGEVLDIADENAVEDYATAQLQLDSGAVVHLTCSWRIHAGRNAVIEACFFGTDGAAAMRNVAGSFLDFETRRLSGTRSEVIAAPPDSWGGRAAVAWARSLTQSHVFDPEIERQIAVAETLDAIYACAAAQALMHAT
jgi:predicted dehydrogenase